MDAPIELGWTHDMLALVQTLMLGCADPVEHARLEKLESYLISRHERRSP